MLWPAREQQLLRPSLAKFIIADLLNGLQSHGSTPAHGVHHKPASRWEVSKVLGQDLLYNMKHGRSGATTQPGLLLHTIQLHLQPATTLEVYRMHRRPVGMEGQLRVDATARRHLAAAAPTACSHQEEWIAV